MTDKHTPGPWEYIASNENHGAISRSPFAQNFKTATDLDLTDREKGALITVLGMLERGEIAHSPIKDRRSDYFIRPSDAYAPVAFNMRKFYAQHDCGTVSCICGWAEHVGGLKAGHLVRKRLYNRGLDQLFDPSLMRFPKENITPAQAAVALRSYLTTGHPRWDEALS